jgi:hypothetical protein
VNEEEQDLELAKEGVKQLLEPVTDIMKRLLGPAANEIGLAWGDSLRLWRLKRTVRLLEDVRRITSDAGLQLKPVAPRLLFPILEGASLQDDEDLRQRWVGLLTNAARTDYDGGILPSFPDMLKQLTSEEAKFLDRVYDETSEDEAAKLMSLSKEKGMAPFPVPKEPLRSKTLKSAHPITIESLERLMLINRTAGIALPTTIERLNQFAPANYLYMTELGRAFVRACRIDIHRRTEKDSRG